MKPEITIVKQSEDPNLSAGTLKNVIAFLCLGSALYIFISLLSYSALDSSFSSVASLSDSVVNLGGPFGAYLSDALFSVAGMGAYLILFIASFAAIRLLFFYKPKNNLYTLVKLSSATVLVLSFSTICEYYFSGDFFPQGSSGGILGEIIFTNLSNIFGVVGSLLFIFIFTLIAASLTFSFSWLTVIDSVGRYSLSATSYLMNALKALALMIFEKVQSIEIKEFFKTKKIITGLSFLSLLAILFQAWLGKTVVDSNLTASTITIHMLMAIVLLFILFSILAISKPIKPTILPKNISILILISIALLLIQTLTGTEVRKFIDIQMEIFNYTEKHKWIENITNTFNFHRSFSWAIVITNSLIFFRIKKIDLKSKLIYTINTLIFLQILNYHF